MQRQRYRAGKHWDSCKWNQGCPQCGGKTPEPTKAYARLKGGPLAPDIEGLVRFTEVPGGVWVKVEVCGLPPYCPGKGDRLPIGPHGFHIHEKGVCQAGDPEDPFLAAGSHWNPCNQPHGNHAGDFPVLFSNDGVAMMSFFTNKFRVSAIIGRSVIIHQSPDDYRTQPAGNSGKRLACGVIRAGE
ncbi:superoxide dismutase family protein [Acetonema longum]|uniref:Superoxide dismutase [Cu-Zn] n=1 Tax=Acetonema longum DSM 6540 TaxID=1009370 RepID=F7NQG2_9FIRM|nr:superoxide dismutase family protein [Acetonema longum]EGO61740.1 Cu-Zn superoxide dismutase [Acetonema longum DSM 6540]